MTKICTLSALLFWNRIQLSFLCFPLLSGFNCFSLAQLNLFSMSSYLLVSWNLIVRKRHFTVHYNDYALDHTNYGPIGRFKPVLSLQFPTTKPCISPSTMNLQEILPLLAQTFIPFLNESFLLYLLPSPSLLCRLQMSPCMFKNVSTLFVTPILLLNYVLSKSLQ